MSARCKTPPASCAHYFRRENAYWRRVTNRAARRELRAWLRQVEWLGDDADFSMPLPAHTGGHHTH